MGREEFRFFGLVVAFWKVIRAFAPIVLRFYIPRALNAGIIRAIAFFKWPVAGFAWIFLTKSGRARFERWLDRRREQLKNPLFKKPKQK